MFHWDGWHMMDGAHMGGAWVWLLLMVFVLVGVGWAIAWTLARSRSGPETAEQVLKRRYAAGELTREEFLQRQSDLRG